MKSRSDPAAPDGLSTPQPDGAEELLRITVNFTDYEATDQPSHTLA